MPSAAGIDPKMSGSLEPDAASWASRGSQDGWFAAAGDGGDLLVDWRDPKVAGRTEKRKARVEVGRAEGTRVFSKARGGKNRGNNGNRGVGGSAVPPRLDQYSHGLLL